MFCCFFLLLPLFLPSSSSVLRFPNSLARIRAVSAKLSSRTLTVIDRSLIRGASCAYGASVASCMWQCRGRVVATPIRPSGRPAPFRHPVNLRTGRPVAGLTFWGRHPQVYSHVEQVLQKFETSIPCIYMHSLIISHLTGRDKKDEDIYY